MFGVLMLTYIRHSNAACNHGEKGRPAANLGWVGGFATVPLLSSLYGVRYLVLCVGKD